VSAHLYLNLQIARPLRELMVGTGLWVLAIVVMMAAGV
jgi:hypothetical protein